MMDLGHGESQETCDEHVDWWEGEYSGDCELPKGHGGPHFDGSSWWDDDRNEVDPPEGR